MKQQGAADAGQSPPVRIRFDPKGEPLGKLLAAYFSELKQAADRPPHGEGRAHAPHTKAGADR